jgi:hypothetical protein
MQVPPPPPPLQATAEAKARNRSAPPTRKTGTRSLRRRRSQRRRSRRRRPRKRKSDRPLTSSAPATAGEGDRPAKQGGGGGAALNATQESTSYADFKFARFFRTDERNNFIAVILLHRQRSSESRAPSTTVRSLRELQWSPSPAIAGAEKDSRSLVITASPAMTTRNCIAAMRFASGSSVTLAKKACLERTGGDLFAPQRGRRSAERRTTVAAPRCAGAAAAR